jgi:transposase
MSGQDQSGDAGSQLVAKRRRGRWTIEQRRQAVADSRKPGATVQEVASRHGVRANLLSSWRRQIPTPRAITKPVSFAAVRVSAAPADGVIEIDLHGGCVRVRGQVDGQMLREVLAAAR